MELFGNNFLDVRNKHIFPLVGYGIPKEKCKFWSLKDTITNKIVSLAKLNGKSVEIEVRKDDYYKSLHCDIELFMNKSTIQYSDFIKSGKSSPSWSLVTLYYLAFFANTCFFRFLSKGFVFLSAEQKNRIEKFSITVNSSPISLDSGNYFFSYKGESLSGNIILTLSSKGEGLHRLNWLQLESTLRDFLPNCDTDEKTIYSLFLNNFSNFKTEFPSNIRNKLNYNGESSILDINDNLPRINFNDINNNFYKGLSKIGNEATTDNQMNGLAYLASFLFEFNNRLYGEYLERSSYGNDFYNERVKYLKLNNITVHNFP